MTEQQMWINDYWKRLQASDRNISKWDTDRTDRGVFVRRTLHKWFRGKYLKVKRWHCLTNRDQDIALTYYVLISHILFGFEHSDTIKVYYNNPFHVNMETVRLSINDLLQMEITEDVTTYKIIEAFYPVDKREKPYLAVVREMKALMETKNKIKPEKIIKHKNDYEKTEHNETNATSPAGLPKVL